MCFVLGLDIVMGTFPPDSEGIVLLLLLGAETLVLGQCGRLPIGFLCLGTRWHLVLILMHLLLTLIELL